MLVYPTPPQVSGLVSPLGMWFRKCWPSSEITTTLSSFGSTVVNWSHALFIQQILYLWWCSFLSLGKLRFMYWCSGDTVTLGLPDRASDETHPVSVKRCSALRIDSKPWVLPKPHLTSETFTYFLSPQASWLSPSLCYNIRYFQCGRLDNTVNIHM